MYNELQCSIRTSQTCPGAPHPSRDAYLLRCPDHYWNPAECRLNSLADITRAGQTLGDSCVSPAKCQQQRRSNCCSQATVIRSAFPTGQSLQPAFTAVGFPYAMFARPSLRHKLFQSVSLHVSNKHLWTWCRNRSLQSLYHTTERGCPRAEVPDLAASAAIATASVSTFRRLNPFFRNASCTHNSLMLRCRTFPEPERAQISLAAELPHKMSRRKSTPSGQSNWHVWVPKAAAHTVP